MKTFLLGVGAQKSATTWLYEYLHAHQHCDLGFKKEYHVFDALLVPELGTRRFMVDNLRHVRNLTKQKIENVESKTPALDIKLEHALRAASFYIDTENYGHYFERLYDANIATKVVGDITPSYSMLEAKDFAFIKRLLERHGFNVKVIFLMRDPVERAYSAARMSIRTLEATGKAAEVTAESIMNRQIKNFANINKRGRYDLTIQALEQVFDADDIHYAFYETIFDNAEVRKVTNFLGIDFISGDFDRKVNASPHPTKLSQKSTIDAKEHFEEVYSFCKTKFGEEFIERIWQGPAI